MSDVPVSTMAWQLFTQKATVPPSWMLEEEEREKVQEGTVMLPCPSPTVLSLLSTTHLSSWICQYPCWVTGTQFRVPVKCEGSKPPKSTSPAVGDSGFLEGDTRDFHSFTLHLCFKWVDLYPLASHKSLGSFSLFLQGMSSLILGTVPKNPFTLSVKHPYFSSSTPRNPPQKQCLS